AWTAPRPPDAPPARGPRAAARPAGSPPDAEPEGASRPPGAPHPAEPVAAAPPELEPATAGPRAIEPSPAPGHEVVLAHHLAGQLVAAPDRPANPRPAAGSVVRWQQPD